MKREFVKTFESYVAESGDTYDIPSNATLNLGAQGVDMILMPGTFTRVSGQKHTAVLQKPNIRYSESFLGMDHGWIKWRKPKWDRIEFYCNSIKRDDIESSLNKEASNLHIICRVPNSSAPSQTEVIPDKYYTETVSIPVFNETLRSVLLKKFCN